MVNVDVRKLQLALSRAELQKEEILLALYEAYTTNETPMGLFSVVGQILTATGYLKPAETPTKEEVEGTDDQD
jgi:aerobic-type carbon monoxide dehydrogenase small subunit (CoxS/CutS family)